MVKRSSKRVVGPAVPRLPSRLTFFVSPLGTILYLMGKLRGCQVSVPDNRNLNQALSYEKSGVTNSWLCND